jgi:hypothetical protein
MKGLAMSITLDCPSCGQRLRVGDEHAGKRARCPSCESAVPVPDEKTYGIALDADDLQKPAGKQGRPKRPPLKPGERPCPNCGTGMKPKAVLCIDCGYDHRLRGQRETESRLFAHSWDGGIGLVLRLLGLLGQLGVAFIFSAILAAYFEHLLLMVLFVPIAALFVVLMGTFPTFRLERTERGESLLRKTQWISFIPAMSSLIDLQKFDRILVHRQPGFDAMGLVVFICVLALTLPLGGCPGLFWWYLALVYPCYSVLLDKKKDEYQVQVYHGWSDVQARELAEMLKELTEYPIERK